MLKRAARFVLLCGLGVVLALLLTWVFDRGGDGFDSRPPDVRPRTVAEPRRPGAAPTGVIVPVAETRPRAEGAAPERPEPVDASATPPVTPVLASRPPAADTIAAHLSTPFEPAAPADAEPSPRDDDERPAAWCFFTSLNHRFRSDTGAVFSGSRSALIEGASTQAELRVNAIVQGIDATAYRGSRVELSVYAETGGETRLFLQPVSQRELEQASNGPSAAPAEKTYRSAGAGWTRYAIVAEVPLDAAALYFGFGNFGTAALRLDAAALERVAADTPLSELFGRRAPLFLPGTHVPVYPAPANLDFEITVGAAGERPSC